MPSRAAPWNHSIAYFPLIEKIANERPRRAALDVGTGDGMLAFRLAATIPFVVGLDQQSELMARASERYAGRDALRFEVGDFLDAQPHGGPFDFVACSATLHHVELIAGISRLAELTAPDGTLVIVGLANNSSALDWLLDLLRIVPVRQAEAGTTTARPNAIQPRR
jgi:2-polyprenyl-3-methyl-5-hydroxy-6-metoxy-1,4-benzoquinol methylase